MPNVMTFEEVLARFYVKEWRVLGYTEMLCIGGGFQHCLLEIDRLGDKLSEGQIITDRIKATRSKVLSKRTAETSSAQKGIEKSFDYKYKKPMKQKSRVKPLFVEDGLPGGQVANQSSTIGVTPTKATKVKKGNSKSRIKPMPAEFLGLVALVCCSLVVGVEGGGGEHGKSRMYARNGEVASMTAVSSPQNSGYWGAREGREEEWGISVGEERRHVGVEYDISDPIQGTFWAEEGWEGCQGE